MIGWFAWSLNSEKPPRLGYCKVRDGDEHIFSHLSGFEHISLASFHVSLTGQLSHLGRYLILYFQKSDDKDEWQKGFALAWPLEVTKQLTHNDYTVAWICALLIEKTTARNMLDELHLTPPQPDHDKNISK